MSYQRLEELPLQTDEDRAMASRLLKDIEELETQIIHDEEFVGKVLKQRGQMVAQYVWLNTVHPHQEILKSLKTVFWYYTGAYASKVIAESDPENEVDIFHPLGV